MSEEWPLVSILVPCYNHEHYIEECLTSIFRQDYDNFEVIVVDDGSTDRSAARIEALHSAHDFTFIRQDNGGVSAALNTALGHARGEYVITHDSDDVMLPGRLRTQVGYLLDHPEVGCLGGRLIYIDQNGRRIKDGERNKTGIRRMTFEELLASAYCVGAPVAMYRREALERVGGYDPSIRIQDFQMTLKISHAGFEVHILPDYLTLYRRHPTNISKTAYKSQLDYDLRVIAPYRDHPAYATGQLKIINKALKEAVHNDKRFARQLFADLPVTRWDRVTWKRFRHFLFKRAVDNGNSHLN